MSRILLVDDEAAMREVVNRALSADGHAITACLDGEDALDRLTRTPDRFELLLSDVEMPGLDGVALAERAAAAAPHLRILLMSGFAGGPERARALATFSVRFIAKPFTLEEIRSAVRAALA
jgi:CheY-like chemotaxis protein